MKLQPQMVYNPHGTAFTLVGLRMDRGLPVVDLVNSGSEEVSLTIEGFLRHFRDTPKPVDKPDPALEGL